VIVLVFVVGEDSEDSLPHHRQDRLSRERRVTSIPECVGDLFGEPDFLIELSDEQESGIA
jgi:hypothetical protein